MHHSILETLPDVGKIGGGGARSNSRKVATSAKQKYLEIKKYQLAKKQGQLRL